MQPESDPEPIHRDEFESFLARGVTLFNQGEYMEAHETFERIWVSTQDSEADFFKGLIQSSICLYHLSRGNAEGAKKLYGGHRRLLAGYLPAHRCLDLEGFLGAMQQTLRPVLRARQETPPPFDAEQRPLLRQI